MGKVRVKIGVRRSKETSWKDEERNKIFLHTLRGMYTEFYTIDLDNDQVIKCPHHLDREGVLCSMVALGSVIYLIGGHQNKNLQGHAGVSYLDLRKVDDGQGWKSAPPLKTITQCTLPDCLAFCGKIYVFGYRFAEVFHPELNSWSLLLPPLGKDTFHISTPVLGDPLNNRIFMRFEGEAVNSLYAYYPSDGCWELLVQNLDFWYHRLAFQNGVIFFYVPGKVNNVIAAAFDVEAKQWLNIVFSDKFDRKARKNEMDALLNLGNGMMCLTFYSLDFRTSSSSPKTSVYAVKFRVERTSPRDVLVTPFPGKLYTLEAFCHFRNYLPLRKNIPEFWAVNHPLFWLPMERYAFVHELDRLTRKRNCIDLVILNSHLANRRNFQEVCYIWPALEFLY